MKEDFLAIIKLMSGEEILSNVCYMDDDEDTLILDCPVMMSSKDSKEFGVNVIRVEPWIKTGRESLYLITLDKIITLTEVIDTKVRRIYDRFVQSYFYNNDEIEIENKMTKEMGYLMTVKEARSTLEKLYNIS